MIKEIIFIKNQDNVKTVHVGVFPSKGRYFRKKLEDNGNGILRTEIDIKCGEIFTQFFINNDFSHPYQNNSDERISMNDPLKRVFFKCCTVPFCAVQFEESERYIASVSPELWGIRAISHYTWIKSVLLVTNKLEEIPFKLLYRNCNRKYWTLRLPRDKTLKSFSLKIKGNGREFFLNRGSIFGKELDPGKFFSFPAKLLSQLFQEKVILPHHTGYQVFPDRFFKFSSPGEDKGYFLKWGDKPDSYSYFGGDIKGIISKLPYLRDLGVDFIYLNPVFHSRSSHRYDTIDYYKIDPLLGDEKDLKELVRQAHRLNIKIILDIPLNHCSVDFFAFKDILQNQEKSNYCDWFTIHRYPVKVENPPAYDAWHGYRELPEFNLDSPAVREYLVGSVLYWQQECGIDGWRLDSVSAMPEDFIRYFADSVGKARKDAVIIGEFWHNDADELFEKCGIDGVTNYSFYWQVFVPLFEKKNIPLRKIGENIMNICYAYPDIKSRYCWNFLSNHDLVRFYSSIGHPQKYMLVVALMYVLPGNPIIYYGEEIGLVGMNDPDNRRCMEWSGNQDSLFYSFFKSLNNMRKNFKSLFDEGTITIPYVNQRKKLLVIERFNNSQSLYFVFNLSRQARDIQLSRILKKSSLTDIMIGVKHESACSIPGFGFKIFLAGEDSIRNL